MSKMVRFWAKKALTTEQLEIYFEKLEQIPVKPWWEIVDYAIDTCRSFPSRSELWDFWIEWQRSNPDKIIKSDDRKECDACDSKGYIDILWIPKWIRKRLVERGKDPQICWHDPRAIYEGVVNCGVCKQYEFAPKSVRFMTPEQIDADPWMMVKKQSEHNVIAEKDLTALAMMATHGMEQDSIPF